MFVGKKGMALKYSGKIINHEGGFIQLGIQHIWDIFSLASSSVSIF